jgi:hypothetical protein
MSGLIIAGDTSGSVTLSSPAVAGAVVITLPVESAKMTAFVTGTRLAFQQNLAPTGWTKDVQPAINDSIMRVVTGTPSNGGSVAFSSWNAITVGGAHQLTIAEMPSHNHGVYGPVGGPGGSCAGAGESIVTGGRGGDQPHTHPVVNAVKYYDFVIASKD